MKQFLLKNKYHLAFWLILLLSLVLRFYNFDVRWGLGNDDSRDIMIAQEALRRHELPLIGSFSSAGPFVFGPIFYWFIMLSYFVFPSIFTIPWIFTGFVGVGTVAVLMWCAKKIAGNNFMLLVGLFAATSPQLVVRSLALGQHTFVSFTTSCMVLSLLFFLEKRKLIFAFLVGLAIGAGINFHYQALNLLVFLAVFFFVPKTTWRFRFENFALAGAGVIVGLLPLTIWDMQQQFANLRNILDYFLIAQYRLYVPNSWRLFIFTFLPNYWAFIIGGQALFALFIMGMTGLVTVFALIKKKLPYQILFLLVPFTALLLLNRFYKGERSEGYLIYFLPFIIVFTAYALFLIIQRGRFFIARVVLVGILALGILYGNSQSVLTILSYQTPVKPLESVIDELVEKYPGQKFVVYDYKGSLSTSNQALSALLFRRGLIAAKGMHVGFLCYERCPAYPELVQYGGLYLADLSKEKNIEQQNPRWINVNPDHMYDDLIGWSKRHELTSNFSIQQYLTDKLHF